MNTIWEGTTNVLSFDLLRVLKGRDGLQTLQIWKETISSKMNRNNTTTSFSQSKIMKNCFELLTLLIEETHIGIQSVMKNFNPNPHRNSNSSNSNSSLIVPSMDESNAEIWSRSLLFLIADTFIGVLMMEYANSTGYESDMILAQEWIESVGKNSTFQHRHQAGRVMIPNKL